MSVTPRSLLNYRQFHRGLLILVLICALSGGWVSALAAPVNETVSPTETEEPTPAALTNETPLPATPSNPTLAIDSFGYTVATAKYDPASFIDATVILPALSFSSTDDGIAGPVAINFPFKFFENTYTTFYVSTNGLITFGRGDSEFRNKPIPYDTLPDNFIAPFWRDLSLGSGGVYVRYMGAVGSRLVVIEWYNVSNSGSQITFEVILHENGDIVFKYKDLAGILNHSTIGIEDPEGLDGLQFLYNSDGLLDPTNVPYAYEIRFTRPAPYARVKVLPRTSSNLTVAQKSTFNMVVRNTGDSGTDTFDLNAQVSDPKWKVTLTNTAGGALTDSNGNAIPDTGQVAAGQEVVVILTLGPATAGLVVGDFVSVNFTARSSIAPEVSMTSTVQTVVPVPFAQVYVDSTGIHLRQTWEKNIMDKNMTWFTGKTLAVRQVSGKDYMVAWEKRSDLYRFTEIEYQVVNQLNPLGKIQVLTNSQEQLSAQVVDSNAEMPTIALAPNGQIGVLWSQRLVRSDNYFNSNIYLSFVDAAGTRVSNRFNLTNDPNYYTSSGTGNYQRFTTHNLVATSDSRFFACWLHTQRLSGTLTTTLNCSSYALINSTQIQLLAGPMIVDAVAGTNNALYPPYLLSLANGQVMIVYNRSTGSGTQVVYSVWNSNGVQALAPTVLPGVVGTNPVGVQFSAGNSPSGNIVLAWADQSGQLGYAYLSKTFALQAGYPKLLPRVTQRSMAYPSVTLESNGRAVVTWTDADVLNSNYLYYLLLDQNGSALNPPMLFHYPIINTSTYGYGNAAYNGVYQVFLAVSRK